MQAPVVFAKVPKYKLIMTTKQCWMLHYFNAATKQWQPLQKFTALKDSASVIVANGIMYAAGGFMSSWYANSASNRFQYYNAGKNKWENLPSMIKSREKFPMVHLDGFIYVFGGFGVGSLSQPNRTGDVERFDIMWNRWETRSPLPLGFQWVSAITFNKKIVVYGVSLSVSCGQKDLRTRKHVLQVYNPSTDIWHRKLEEKHGTCIADSYSSRQEAPDATLLIYKDHCYRVLYQTPTKFVPVKGLRKPSSVTRVKLQSEGDGVKVSLGKSFSQDLIPANNLGAFRIQDEVFVNVKGSVYKTELKIRVGQTTDVDLTAWQGFIPPVDNKHSNIVYFTFDKKKLGYYR